MIFTPHHLSKIKGVRFRILGSHLNLEVRVTPFDFITGTLDASKTHWVGNDNTELSELDSKRFVMIAL